jgi:hypothetical protein
VGDRYLLCSDGLYTVVTTETLHEVLSTIRDPEQMVGRLIELVNHGGEPDNIACVVAGIVRPTTFGRDSPVAGLKRQEALPHPPIGSVLPATHRTGRPLATTGSLSRCAHCPCCDGGACRCFTISAI